MEKRVTTEVNNRIQAMLDDLVAPKKSTGLQMAVYFEGELVVDAYAGLANPATETPVDGRTLFPIFSTCKGISATIIHRLVEQGKLEYDKPVYHYWPEFAAHGKTGITLRHILTHSAGLPNMPLGITYEEICDWDTVCSRIADLVPVNAPGECQSYHAMTYGWLVAEVAHRADGRDFQRLLKEEICDQIGDQDGYIGIPDEVEPRVAILEDLNPIQPGPEPTSISPGFLPLHESMNDPRGRRSIIAGSSGIMSARFIARHFAALAPGGINGIELLPQSRLAEALTPFRMANGEYSTATGGYGLSETTPEKRGRVFGSGGYGGSAAMCDLVSRLAVAFAKNRLNTENEYPALLTEVRSCLGL